MKKIFLCFVIFVSFLLCEKANAEENNTPFLIAQSGTYSKDSLYKERNLGGVKQISRQEPKAKKQAEEQAKEKKEPTYEMSFTPRKDDAGKFGAPLQNKVKAKDLMRDDIRKDSTKNIIKQMEANGITLSQEQKQAIEENPEKAKEVLWEATKNLALQEQDKKFENEEDKEKMKERKNELIERKIKILELRSGMKYKDMVNQSMSLYGQEPKEENNEDEKQDKNYIE